MPTYKLHYFNLDGRGELIRIMLAYGGIKYEDIRYGFDEFPKIKDSGKFAFKQIPVLEVDGHFISQSNTIARYLARALGIDGQNDVERAKADMVADSCTYDIVEKAYSFRAVFAEPDEQKRIEKGNAFRESTLEAFMNNLDAIYQKIGGQYMVGDKLTYADLAFYRMIGNVKHLLKDLKTPHPNLHKVYERIAGNPNIAAWEKSKPEVLF